MRVKHNHLLLASDILFILLFLISISAMAAPPRARNIYISGTTAGANPTTFTSMEVGFTLRVWYSYVDPEGDPESGTTFQWYSYTDEFGGGKTAIAGATSQTLTLTAAQQGRYISVEVRPKNAVDGFGATVEWRAFSVTNLNVVLASGFSCSKAGGGVVGPGNNLDTSSPLCSPRSTTWVVFYTGIDYSAASPPRIYIDWADGVTNVYLPNLQNSLASSNDSINLTNQSNQRWQISVNKVYSYPTTGGSSTPSTTANQICTYTLRASWGTQSGTCIFSGVQTQPFTVWDRENNTSLGVFDINKAPSSAGVETGEILDICERNQSSIRLLDASDFNCTAAAPRVENVRENNEGRWIQWVYGTTSDVTTGPGASEKIIINGVSYTSADLPVYGRVTYQASPTTAPLPSTTDNIQMPTSATTGQTMVITMRSWNTCNPLDRNVLDGDGLNPPQAPPFDVFNLAGTTNQPELLTQFGVAGGPIFANTAPVTRTHTIRIITKPTPPLATNKEFCAGTILNPSAVACGAMTPTQQQQSFELTSASVTGSTTINWYFGNPNSGGVLLTNSYGSNCRFFRAGALATTGAQGAMRTALLAGTNGVYSLWATYATANGCVSDPVQVSLTIRPSLTPPSVPIGPIEVCNGASGVTFSQVGAPTNQTIPSNTISNTSPVDFATEYLWSTSNGDVTLSALNSTTTDATFSIVTQPNPTATRTISTALQYSIATADGSRCVTSSASISLTVYGATLGGTVSGGSSICEGNSTGTLSLTGQRGTVIRWERDFNNSGTFVPIAGTAGLTSYNETPSSGPGTYQYRAVVRNGPTGQPYNCANVNSNSTTVTVNPIPSKPAITPSGPTTFCQGSSVVLQSNNADGAAASYQWFRNGIAVVGETGATLTLNSIAQNGNYTVQKIGVTPSNCLSELSDPVTVQVNALPTASNANGGGSVCGSPAPDITWTLSGKAPFAGTWTNGTLTFNFTQSGVSQTATELRISAPNTLVDGIYQILTLVDDNGCSATDLGGSILITVGGSAPSIDPGSALSISSACDDGALTADPSLNFSLDDVGSSNSGPFILNYRIDGGPTRTKTFNTGANGNPTTAITFSDVELNSLAPSPHVIALVSLQSPSGCQTLLSNSYNFIVNLRPNAPTGAINSLACSSGAGAALSVSDPGVGLEIAWSTGGTSLASFNAVAVANGTVGGTRNVNFTPATSASQTFYAFVRNTTTGCLSSTGVAVTQTQDPAPTASAPAPVSPRCDGNFTLNGNNPGGLGEIGTWAIPGVVLYQQPFNSTLYPDGTTVSVAANGWTRDISAANVFDGGQGHFHVQNGQFELNNADGNAGGAPGAEVVWQSPVLTGAFTNLNISIVLSSTATHEAGDYLRVFYKLNGGAEITLTNGNQTGNISGAVTATASALTGTSLQLIVRANNNAADEFYRFDSILIAQPGAPVISNPNDRNATVTGVPVGSTILSWSVSSRFGVCSPSSANVTLTRNPLPSFNDQNPVFCEDVESGGLVNNINLNDYSAAITGIAGTYVTNGVSQFEDVSVGVDRRISWFTNTTRTLPVTNASDVDGIVNNQKLYYRVTTISTSCTSDGEITFAVNSRPVATTGLSYTFCPDMPPGNGAASTTANINLTAAIPVADIIGAALPAQRTVTYHNTLADAQTNVGAITSVALTATRSIFAKVTNILSGCVNTTEISLLFQPRAQNNQIKDALNNVLVDGLSGSAPFTASRTFCASGSLILLQIDPSRNPGASYTWNIPAPSYIIPVGHPANPSATTPAPEFEVLTGLNNVFVILKFPYSTNNPPSGFISNFGSGIPITVFETLGSSCTGNPLTLFVNVDSSPVKPLINGPAEVCANGVATYTITPGTEGITNTWSIPPGATITNSPSGSSINIQMGTFGGQVSVIASSGTGCVSPQSDPISVDVIPRPTFTFTVNDLCSGNNVSSVLTLNPSIPAPLNPADVRYNWTVQTVSPGVSGANIGDAATGVTTINQVLTNTSGINGQVIYSVTAIGPAATFCAGETKSVIVNVLPRPIITPNQQKTICNNTAAGMEIMLTPANLPATTLFSWPDPDAAGPATARTNVPMGAPGTIHINDVLSNTTDNLLSVTYAVTANNGVCPNTPVNVVIVVEPTPKVDVPVNNAPLICSGGTPNFQFTSPTVPTNTANLTFDVSLTTLPAGVIATGIASTGVTNVSASAVPYVFSGGTLTNTTNSKQTVVYTITPKLNGCANGTTKTVSVIVDPVPAVTTVNSAARICSGGAPNFTIDSPTLPDVVANLTFDIVPTIPAGINATGNANTGVTGILKSALPFVFTGGTLTNTTNANITATYEVIPKLAGCANGPSQTINVIVEPNPVAAFVNNNPIICSGASPSISITTPTTVSTPSDLTFDVVVTLPGGVTGTGAAGSGLTGVSAPFFINTGTLTNTTNSYLTVTYEIIPKVNGCGNGPSQFVDVEVEPVPQANNPINNATVICNGGTPNIEFTSPTTPTNVANLSFDVSVALPAGVTGAGNAASGVTSATAPFFINTGTLTNANDDFKTVVYTITPKLSGCANGPTKQVSVRVDPTPRANTPINSAPTICNGGTPHFSFTTPTLPNTPADLTFDITVSLPTGVTGTGLAANGATGVSASAVTAYVLNSGTLTNTNDAFATVTYTITPRLGSCNVGPTQIVTVRVEPTPTLNFTSTLPVLCNGGTPNISVTTLTAPTTPANLTFDVSVLLPGGVTGTGVAANGLVGTTAPFFINSGTLTNNTTSSQQIRYRITPKLNGCADGAFQDIFITLEPTPQALFTSTPRICNGDSPNIQITSPTTPSASSTMTFDVTVSLPVGVTGTLAAGNGVTGATAPFAINTGTLTNNTSLFKTVTYTITPRLSGGCANGPAQIVDVIVEPTPTLVASNNNPTICNGGTPNILVTSPTTPSVASDLTFNVVAILPPGVTGTLRAANGVTGASAPFSINTGTLTNSTNSFQVIEYVITPLLNGCPSGAPQSVFVTLEPTPQADLPTTTTPVVCNGGTPVIDFTTPSMVSVPANLTFDVTVNLPAGVTGTGDAASGRNGMTAPFQVNSGTLTNSTNSFKTIVYTITPRLSGCASGPTRTISIDLEPTPQAAFVNSLPAICSGDSPNINVTTPTGAKNTFDLLFDVTVNLNGATGTGVAANGLTNVAAPFSINTGTLVHNNTSNAPIQVSYIITPKLGGCSTGPVQIVNVSVRPEPVGVSSIPASPVRSVCSREAFTYNIQTENIDILGNQVLSKFTFTLSSSNESLVPTPPGLDRTVASSNAITGTFTNKSNVDVFITYTVTPYNNAGDCIGDPFDVLVRIHPEPDPVTAAPAFTTIERCSGESVNFDLQSLIRVVGSNTLTSKFRYTVIADKPLKLAPVVEPGTFDRTTATSALITDVFNNTSDEVVTLTYTVTPISAVDDCEGLPFILRVRYYQEPTGQDFTDPDCSGGLPLNHDLQSQITNGVASLFFYTVSSDNPGVAPGPDRPQASASADLITDTYVNNTSNPANITYTVTAIRNVPSTPNCIAQTTFKYIVRVDQEPVGVSGSIPAKCSDEVFSINPQSFITNSVISNFTWTATYDGSPLTSPGITNVSYNNTSTTFKDVVYRFTPTSQTSTCEGAQFTVTVRINPEPVMVNPNPNPNPLTNLHNICSSNAVSGNNIGIILSTTAASAPPSGYNITLKSIESGLTGVGSTPTTVGSIGLNLSANTLASYRYRNVTAAQLKVVFTITPVSSLGCLGDPIDFPVLVNPEPVLAASVIAPVCSDNLQNPSPINIILGTNGTSVNAQTYSVQQILYSTSGASGPFGAVVPSGVTPINQSLGSGGISLIKNDSYNNVSDIPITVRYMVQGFAPPTPNNPQGCSSEPFNYDVQINPEPTLAVITPSVCSGESIGTSITLNPSAGSPAISSYELKQALITDSRVTAGSANATLGFYPGGTPTFLENDKFFNVADMDLTVTYKVVSITGATCRGLEQDIMLTVRPAPAVAAGLDAKVCSESASDIELKDNSASNPSATFPYSVAASQYQVTSVTFDNTKLTVVAGSPGASPPSTNFDVLKDDKFRNTTNDAHNVTYKVVPFSSAGCRGPEKTILLTVEPQIVAVANGGASPICSGTPTSITFSSPSNPTPVAVPPLITFNYSMQPVSGGGISGNTSGANVAAGTIADNLVNSTNNKIDVTYRVTAVAASAANGKGCTSAVTTVQVAVEPKPHLIPTRTAQTVCEGTAIAAVTLNSNTVPSTGSINFILDSVVDPDTDLPPTFVSGSDVAGSVYSPGQLLDDILDNTTALQKSLRYTFTPRFASGLSLCQGDPVSINIVVNPRPLINVTPGTNPICSGETFQAQMNTDTDASSTIVTWTALAPSIDIVGESGGAGNELFQTLVNKGNQPNTVNYSFTSSFNGCSGNVVPLTVTVNPTPVFTPPARQVVCAGQVLNLDLTTLTTTDLALTTFQWSVTDINDIGAPGEFNGSGKVINRSFTNNTNSQATLIYQVTPIGPGGCTGIDRILNVAVAPTINGAFLSPDEQLCEGAPVFLTFDLQGQAPFDFEYKVTDANGTVTNRSVTRSGNIKVERVTPNTSTVYEIVSIKDGLGCTRSLAPQPKVTITVFKKITANWVANIPPFVGGTAAVAFTNTSNPVDESTFRYEWIFGTDNAPDPADANGVGPFTVNYSRPGDHFVSLRAVNKLAEAAGQNCESSFLSKITIPVLPLTASFKFEPSSACFPENITVTENTATGDVMEWRVIDSNGRVTATSTAPLPEFLITSPGTYTISLKTSNSFTGQSASADPADVTIYGNPVASFDVRPLLVYVPDTELTTFNFSTGATEYLWDFGDDGKSTEKEPKYTYQIEGIYDITLIAINDHGDGAVCTDTLTRQVTAKQGGITRVPNAFTPNLNGSSGGVPGNNAFNDVFLPLVKGAEEFNMQVYDRWGNLVFESNSANIGWDGYDQNGKLMPAGVYVYKLTVRLSDGQRSTQVGDITMIR